MTHLFIQESRNVCIFFLYIVDECLIDNGGCEHHCQDTPLYYVCECDTGYTLNTNGQTCDGNDINELVITGATPKPVMPAFTQYQSEDEGNVVKRDIFSILSCSNGDMATLTSCYSQCLQLAETVGT